MDARQGETQESHQAEAVRPRFPLPSPRTLVMIGVLVLIFGALYWRFGRGTEVRVASVTRGTAAEIVYATGSVEPENWARVTPLVKGRLAWRCHCEGDRVKAGTLLARLDDKEAQATLSELKAQENFAKLELERQTQLIARNVTTAQSLQKAQSDLSRLQASVSAQTERLDYYRLVAPMDGVVLKEDGEVGDIVDSASVLYRVGEPKPLRVIAQVNEEDIPRVKEGQKVLLRADAFADTTLEGSIHDITPAGDPVAKTFRVRIALPDTTPLHIGMSVEANIVSRDKAGVLLVPANALVDGAVMVVDGSRARKRKIEIGIRGTRFVEILSGLSQGDEIVAPANATLRDGGRIRAVHIETDK